MKIDIHPSASADLLQPEIIASLRANRLDPKGLYLTARQAALWRQVSLRHSPMHIRPDFRRIYDEAFARIANRVRHLPQIELVALGSGTGEKEVQLYRHLQPSGGEIHFTAIDAGETLARESAGRLVAAGAHHRRSLVCDLARVDFLAAWLDEHAGAAPRVITFFGLVPNFEPSRLGPILRAFLRPQDVLLASVHLVPALSAEKEAVHAAMRAVLPQYDNAETGAWLQAALETWNLHHLVDHPEISIGEVEDVPAFLGQARWKTTAPFEKWGETFTPQREEPLRLFQSLRYTPQSFAAFLNRESLTGEPLALTSCREEGIWAIRSG